MKNAVILHGLQDRKEYYANKNPAPGNNHWFPWIQKQLLLLDIYAETPTIYQTYKASYEDWVKTVERCHHIDEDTILVGHSCGGGFLVRWLSENKEIKVGKVVLVAPWLNLENSNMLENGEFFQFDIDPEIVSRTKGITIFSSDNDVSPIKESIKLINDKVKGVNIQNFHDYGHFCYEDMGTEEFPELLKEVTS